MRKPQTPIEPSRINLKALNQINAKYVNVSRFREREHDPVLDQVLGIMDESGTNFAYMLKHSGLSRSTLHNWTNRKVRRPQNASIEMALRALGYTRKIVPLES